jgi:hypothetical protein
MVLLNSVDKNQGVYKYDWRATHILEDSWFSRKLLARYWEIVMVGLFFIWNFVDTSFIY